ncbi:MAG: flagellar type III secretion system protein FliR [Pseudomonadales bacterium]|nr:flagellar type III secretion system protein FliR [Pseudomonadales bacterium]
MLEIPVSEITAWIGRYLWPFFRVSAFFMAMPVIGTQLVPMRVRLGLSVVVTLVVAPLLPIMPRVDGLSLTAYLLIGQQVLLGVVMAFVLQLLFQIFIVAGQMISYQMGLGFASIADPVNGVSVAVLSQFYLMLTMLLFLSMNGHLVVIDVLVESFRVIPVSMTPFDVGILWQIASWGAWMFSSAVIIALPAVTALLVVNFSFGIMNRAAPQLNIFSLGFPFAMLFGLLIVYISLSGFLPQYQGIAEEGLIMLRQLVRIP